MMAGLFSFPLAALLLQRAAGLRVANAVRTPKVFYLFLANDTLLHEDIWMDYFSQGVRGRDYEALLHCIDDGGCQRNIQHQEIFTQIATVPSGYCGNLIDPMAALLAAAYNISSPNDGGMDKFVFVSHNSLPVKPFRTAQRTLTEGNAGLAFFSSWVEGGCYKASQWSVLSRPQASRLLDVVGQPLEKQNRWNCMSAPGSEVANLMQSNESSKHRSGVCVDEFWPMLAVFGQNPSEWHSEPDEDLMRTLRRRKFTWTDWDHPAWSEEGGRIFFMAQDNAGFFKTQGIAGPATVVKFTPAGLREFASSEFLFMRKVVPDTTYEDSSMALREAFRQLVFGL